MPSPRRGRLTSRGSSLIEVLVVTVLLAALTTASLVWFSAASRPDADSAARSSLLAVAELERSAFSEGSSPIGPEDLASRDASQLYVSGPSTGPGEVSILVSGTTVLAATMSGGLSCWMLQLELVPSPLAPPSLWWVGEVPGTVSECAASEVPALPRPAAGSAAGARSDAPIVLR